MNAKIMHSNRGRELTNSGLTQGSLSKTKGFK